jgi:GT2 family glycosyltransferase
MKRIPDVSIIIVTYNSEEEISTCLESIYNQDNCNFEIFIVDNASSDKTQEIIKDHANRCPVLRIILNNENYGLAYANNQPLSMSSGRYLLILNPDTVLKTNTISLLTSYLDQQLDIGVVGPKSYFADGSPHVSFHHNWSISHILLWRFGPYGLIRDVYDRLSNYKEGNVLFVSGACLMIRREVFKAISGYDDIFFLAIEDVVDLCIRVKNRKQRVVFYPTAEIIHLGGRSYKAKPYIALYEGCLGSLNFIHKYKGKWIAILMYACFLVIASLETAWFTILAIINSRKYRLIYELNKKLVHDMLTVRFRNRFLNLPE